MKNMTVNAMEVLQRAQSRAYELKHAELEPLHVLWALLSETGLATNTIQSFGDGPSAVSFRSIFNSSRDGLFIDPSFANGLRRLLA